MFLKNIKFLKFKKKKHYEDIACMKLSAISSIVINKDYIDLYYIFQEYVFNMLK